jgi:hypothetical protein
MECIEDAEAFFGAPAQKSAGHEYLTNPALFLDALQAADHTAQMLLAIVARIAWHAGKIGLVISASTRAAMTFHRSSISASCAFRPTLQTQTKLQKSDDLSTKIQRLKMALFGASTALGRHLALDVLLDMGASTHCVASGNGVQQVVSFRSPF